MAVHGTLRDDAEYDDGFEGGAVLGDEMGVVTWGGQGKGDVGGPVSVHKAAGSLLHLAVVLWQRVH